MKLLRKTIAHEEIISALLSTRSIAEASQKLGIQPRTIYNRMKREDFMRLYAEARKRLLKATTEDLQKMTASAVRVLADIMNNESVPANTRIYSATSILQYATKYTELHDVLERIEALEIERERNRENEQF